MPSSGELRLRTLILALVALSGIWIALVIQRTHHAPAASFAAGPQPSDFPAPKLVHVAGLKRPASSTPIVTASPAPALVSATPVAPEPAAPKARIRPARADQTQLAVGSTVLPDGTRASAETSPPPLEPLAIADAQVVAVTASSARIAWRTNVPTQAQTAFGLDGPTIWAQPSGQSLIEHVSDLGGLEYSTTYHVYLHAVDEWNRAQTQTLTLTTGPMPESSAARTSGDHILVDDRPFFPSAVWGQCSDMLGSNIDDGINLFMGDGCDEDTELPARLGGRAYSIVDAESADANGRGLIGWFFQDEWDAFLQSDD